MKLEFDLQTAKVAGTPANGFWSQVHTFFPDESQKKEKRGNLLAVLVISGVGEGIEAITAGREVLGRIHEEYYGNLAGGSFERLKLSVKKVSEENRNIEITAGAVLGNVLYLATFGKGKVLLKRGGQLGVLIDGSEDLKSASGFLEDNDLLVFGSAKFFSAVGTGVLRAALENGSVDEAEETLAPIVLSKGESVAAAIIALAKKKSEMEIKPVEEMQIESEPVVLPPPVKKSLFQKISEAALPLRNFRKPIFVKNEEKTKKRKLYLLLSVALLISFAGLSFLGIRKTISDKKEVEARKLLKQAEEKLNQGKLVAANDPGQGKVLGAEVVKLADEAVSISNRTNGEASVIKEQTQSFLSTLATEDSISEPIVFMDLNLITDGALGNSFVLIDKNLTILDANKKKIYLLDYEKKSNKIVDFSAEGGKLITSIDGKVFVLNNEGIWEASLVNQKPSLKIKTDEAWKEIVGLGSFGSNLYLLDKGAGLIWRYAGDNFNQKTNWLADKSDLSSAVSLAIDGSIWVLEKDKILKFTFGEQESFSLSKMPGDFGETIKIFTSSEAENLYILDKGRGKVWVINKNGEYKGSYMGEWIKQGSDIIAIESIKKIFVLSGKNIYEIGIK